MDLIDLPTDVFDRMFSNAASMRLLSGFAPRTA
jgi:hypothetical protein